MSNPEMKKVESSQIHSIGYDPEAKELHVEFKTGARYSYADVPASLWRDFDESKSKGTFFHKLIKNGGFEYRRLTPPRPR